jgi:arylsulfatase A-like enzyme
MISRSAVLENAGTAPSSLRDAPTGRPGLISLIGLATWCGLVAGLLEVATIVARKRVFDPNHHDEMSHHFVWLIPATNVVVFLALAVPMYFASCAWPSRGRWLLSRGLCAFTILPLVLVGFPRIYGLAWLVVVLGLATRLVPLIERHEALFRRLVQLAFPVVALTVATLAASTVVGDWINQSREHARSLPPPGSPNVLLVVMDTVAAGHMGLNGYPRSTSPTLVELAERGVRFDSARSASSWTLSSHATMFTGRWLHDLSVGWFTPLDRTYPTVAEYLGTRGFATSGFVANYSYCARDSGLARGFTRYQDFIFPRLTCFKMSALVSRALAGIQAIEDFLEQSLRYARFRPYLKYLWWLLDTDRKGAAEINREFVDWLSRRSQPERPFFAFLNYYDAHSPFQIGPGRMHRFGAVATENRQRDLIQNWWETDKSVLSSREIDFAIDAYDECIADLDEQLGVLFDELEHRGVLGNTWLFIVSDHGESFGEHAGVFCHGTSLYQTEIHVPLLIVPPGGTAKRVVKETVSLRDLAATIMDVTGSTADSPFPGESLTRFWQQHPAPGSLIAAPSPGLAEVVPNDPLNQNPASIAKRTWPLGGLADQDWSYIRREGDVREELFHLSEDKNEQKNLAADPAARARLDHMRDILKKLTGGPLLPERFNP